MGVSSGEEATWRYLRLEAHVKHAVGLVKHHVCGPMQVGDAA